MAEPWPSVRLIGLTMPVHDVDYEDQLPLRAANDLGPEDSAELNSGLDIIEFAGRWDYGPKSIAKMGDTGIIKRWLDGGEESMIEMVDAIFLITCSRVVSHELVRHRLASYQQESQRFVNYEEEDPNDLLYGGSDIAELVLREEGGEAIGYEFGGAYGTALAAYNKLRELKVPKQLARYVLPNSMRTRIVVKANLREWRHILRLRLHTSAQPEMRTVVALVHKKLAQVYGPDLFPDNIAEERAAR